MKIATPTPELPVHNVAKAQKYYRDQMGFEINWHNKEGRLGAVSNGECAIFFRETDADIQPATFWIHADDVDSAFKDLTERGANITDPISDKPWGMRQFTVVELNGNVFYWFCDFEGRV